MTSEGCLSIALLAVMGAALSSEQLLDGALYHPPQLYDTCSFYPDAHLHLLWSLIMTSSKEVIVFFT